MRSSDPSSASLIGRLVSEFDVDKTFTDYRPALGIVIGRPGPRDVTVMWNTGEIVNVALICVMFH